MRVPRIRRQESFLPSITQRPLLMPPQSSQARVHYPMPLLTSGPR